MNYDNIINKIKSTVDRQTNQQTKTAARATHTNTLCHKHTQSHEKSYTHEHTSSQLLELLFFLFHQYGLQDEHIETENQN